MNKFIITSALKQIAGMNKRIRVVSGGSSSSKTFSIIAILINDCITNPNHSVSVVSESLPHLKRGAIKDFLNIMKTTNRYQDKKWNRTDYVYTFSNGSYIEFFGVEDANKLRGARRVSLFVNEVNRVSEEAFTQLAMRSSGIIYIDFNPVSRFWAHNLDNSQLINLTYKNNEALTQETIDFLESKRKLAVISDYWKNWVNVYLDGIPGSLEGVIFNNWEEIDTIPEEATLIATGLDFGYSNDPTACISAYKYNDSIILDEVIYQKGLLNSDIDKLLKDNNVTGEIYGDSAEPKSIAELKKHGHKIYPVTKGPDSIMYGISIMQEYKLLVTKRSINLKNELTNYIWKKDKDGNSLNIPIDAYNHAIDSVRYLAMMKLGKKRVSILDEDSYKITSSRIPMGY